MCNAWKTCVKKPLHTWYRKIVGFSRSIPLSWIIFRAENDEHGLNVLFQREHCQISDSICLHNGWWVSTVTIPCSLQVFQLRWFEGVLYGQWKMKKNEKRNIKVQYQKSFKRCYRCYFHMLSKGPSIKNVSQKSSLFGLLEILATSEWISHSNNW